MLSMKAPPSNPGPDASPRDQRNVEPALPNIDPGWRRRPMQREEPNGAWLAIVATLIILCTVWVAKTWQPGLNSAPELVESPTASTELAEREARLRQLADENQRLLEAQAQQERDAEQLSSFNGRQIHRCRYGATESAQLGPCIAPWMEAPQEVGSSRWQQVQEQEQMRLAAEAKLASEQRRYQAAIGSAPAQVDFGRPPAPAGPDSERCIDAKARRDEAYRIVGNDRTFNFIRTWNDIVYEACKG